MGTRIERISTDFIPPSARVMKSKMLCSRSFAARF